MNRILWLVGTWIVLSYCMPQLAKAQKSIKIKGNVIDIDSGLPLAFATISISGSHAGVVTNSSGAFEFSFPKKYQDDSIKISTVGYYVLIIPVKDVLKENQLQFALKNQIIVLEEVVVTNKEISAEEILKLAIKNIKNNYPNGPFELKLFYRDYKIEDGKCVSLFEAAATVYDKGYPRQSPEKVTLNHVRKSLTGEFKYHGFMIMNTMRELLRMNDVRYVSRALKWKKNNYAISIEGYESIGDRLVYKIKALNDWKFYFYVDIENYAIRKMELDYVWLDGVAENKWSCGDTIKHEQRWAKEILEFQEVDGKLYPRYHNFNSSGMDYDLHSGDFLFEHEIFQEYLVNEVNTNPTVKPEKNSLLDPHEIIENQESNYDRDFWENYNIVKLNPTRRQLLEELEENQLMGKQFDK
ncbi:MAG: carboxypeptidase-like regulatory domain-containing protein [Reichenbachiella sp.]